MATTYKVLGQVKPIAATESTLYTVPSATEAVCSTLSICNSASVADAAFRVRIKINNAADDDKQYVCFDAPISSNDTLLLTFGATLGAGDVVNVYSSTENLTFQLFGSEIA